MAPQATTAQARSAVLVASFLIPVLGGLAWAVRFALRIRAHLFADRSEDEEESADGEAHEDYLGISQKLIKEAEVHLN